MKPFSSIAIPHKDILEGRFKKDTFAANLWEVYKGRATEEYNDPEIFFKRTFLTEGISTLLKMVEKRLKGENGYPIIQLETPFGGGKTHSLIALYHKAVASDVKVVVFDGYALSPTETLIWQDIEKQLTGKVERFKGNVPPAGEQLRALFSVHQPLLILMDEILEYTIAASAIRIDDSFLATQVLNFIRYLTDTIRTLDKTALVITYPSKSHYDEHGQKLFEQLQLRSGRVSVPYLPVKDEEIQEVVVTRLFKSIEHKAAKEVIENFLDYAENEKLLPAGVSKAIYRKKFFRSFPFQPEVIDILYKRWGSFPQFERTRGVLFLLASVVHTLKNSQIPFIRLADFELDDNRIRSILIDVLRPEWNSIIAQDVTSPESGAKKVDKSLPSIYSPYSLGTNVANTIFLYSFSGGPEKGATTSEIKLSSAHISIPSSITVEAIDKLVDPLISLYLDYKDNRYFYTTEITLPRILIVKMECVSDDDIKWGEKEFLSKSLTKEHFELFLWPKSSNDISDTKKLKLVVLKNKDEEKCKEFMENYGERPRIYRNILIFLCPMDSERISFKSFFKEKLGWQLIDKDKTLRLTPEQSNEVKERMRKAENEARERIGRLYRIILLPSKDGLKEINLGIPTYGAETGIDKEIYKTLRSEEEIKERLAPLTLKEKYLKDRDYVESKNILESFFNTPGEVRITSDEVLRDCIKEGVEKGLFGVGDIEDEKPVCRYFKTEFSPELVEGEILIRAELCKPKEVLSDEEFQSYIKKIQQAQDPDSLEDIVKEVPLDYLSTEQREQLENEKERRRKELEGPTLPGYRRIKLKLNVPSGRFADIVKLLNYIKIKFNRVNVEVEISAQNGEISTSDYDNKIKEAIDQADIIIDEEELE